ncbi:MAG: hypothetical protein RMI45_02910 [Ignisphaera sp.]|nr:hypothetical protein [Ignisphaera sp.]MDW8085175.1 hypothetical protein [Ignisphaera sp.]
MNCRTILLILAVVASITLSASLSTIHAEFLHPRNRVFSYTVDVSRRGVSLKHIAAIDIDRLLVAGTINNSNGVAVLNINDPYIGVVVEQVYPLTGSPTCIAVDGFPIKRVAVGSDRGEVLLFNIEGGRIKRYVHTVLGADFYVNKVYLARSAGSYKVVVLASEGGPRTVPCTRCYAYIFDEALPGAMRIGPRTGNATVAIERVYVQDIVPLTVFDTATIYGNASLVALAHVPAALTTLEFSVSYLYNNTLYPAPNTLVEILAYDRARGVSYLYGVNADARGNVSIPIPAGFHANLSIKDLTGRVVWSMVFDPAKHIAVDGVVTLPQVILSTPPDTRSATRVYGTPEFLKVVIEVLDISNTPSRYTVVASSNFRLDVDSEGLSFVTPAREPRYTLVFGHPSKGELNLVRVSIAGRTLRRVLQITDYVGVNAAPVASVTYADGSYLHVALSDGRIRVYRSTDRNYTLHYIYPMDAPVRKLLPIPAAEGYTYTAITTRGVQVLATSPTQIPIIRNATTLYGYVPNYVDGDALADLSTLFLASSGSITVVRNVDMLAKERRIAALDEIKAPSLVLRISLPGNESYDKVIVDFTYPQGIIRLKPDREGLVRIDNLVPISINYSVSVRYEEPHVVPEDRMVVLAGYRNEFIEIPMRYREYTVRIRVFDPVSREPIAPYSVYVDGKPVAEGVKLPEIYTRVIYGFHTILVKPDEGYEAVYEPFTLSLQVDGDEELEVQLNRKLYTLTLHILDRVSNASPIVSIQVRLPAFGRVYILSPGEHLEVLVPYGNTTVYVEPARGWEKAYSPTGAIVEVSRNSTYTVYIDRIKYTVRLNVLDEYTRRLVAPVEILVNNTLVYRGSDNTVNFVVDYGAWNLSILPYREGAYTPYTTTIRVDSDRELNYILNRTVYGVVLEIRDVYGPLLVPLNVSISGVVSVGQVLRPPMTRVGFALPYGEYRVHIEPLDNARRVYLPVDIGLTVRSDTFDTVAIERIKYRLNITVRDAPIGRLVGVFDLYANKSMVHSGVRGTVSISIPCGAYSVELVPQPPWDAFYEPSKPLAVTVFNNTSLTITVGRRAFDLRITVVEGMKPVENAIVSIESLETGITITQLITDEDGVVLTKVPYGVYRVTVMHPDYHMHEIVVNMVSDIYEIANLRPSITTLIMRYLPIVGVLVGAAVSIYIVLKIRAIILRRLAPEEELF